MLMKRSCAMIGLVVLTMLPASTSAAARQNYDTDCDDISTFIEMVDMQVAEDMHALVTSPGWVEDAQRTEGLLEGNDSRGDKINPFVAYLSVPGVVLAGIDPADVPESAEPLHESATTYWVTTADMIEAMVKDGPSASFPFLETLENAAMENIAAQADIVEQCPELPESYDDDQVRLDALFAILDEGGDPGLLANSTLADLEGMGFFFLFFGEEEIEADRITVESTPATVQPILATPED